MQNTWRDKATTFFLVLLILSIALGLTYRELFTGDWNKLSGRYDVYRAAGPLGYFMDHCIHNGELPLWNPLTLCGMPYAANPITMLYYPPNLVRSLLSSPPTPFKTQVGLTIMMAIHMLIAGIGIAFLGRAHGQSRIAAAASACIFLLSAIWVRRVSEYHFIFMVAWLPWLLLIARHAVFAGEWRRKAVCGIGAGLIFGLSLLTGTINVAPYMAATVGAYTVLLRLLFPGAGAERPSVRGFFKSGFGDGFFLILLFVVAGLAGMALLLPGSELAGLSSRVKGSEYALQIPHYDHSWQQLFRDLIRYPGMQFEVEDIRGAGVGALLLVTAGALTVWRRPVWLMAALFAVLFDLSMGPPAPISRLFYAAVPLQMIASTRAFDSALLPAALLAGFGIDTLGTRARHPMGRMALALLLLGLGAVLLSSLKPLLGGPWLPMSTWGLFVPGAALFCMVTAGWFPGVWLWRVALLCLIVAETLVWNAQFVPKLLYAEEYGERADRAFSSEFWKTNRRGVDYFQNRHLYGLRGVMHGYEPVHIERVRNVLSGGSRAVSYQRSVKSHEVMEDQFRGHLLFKRQFWLAKQYVAGPLPDKQRLFPAATTVFLEDPPDLPVKQVSRDQLPDSGIDAGENGAGGLRRDFVSPAAMERIRKAANVQAKDRYVELPEAPTGGLHSVLVTHVACARSVTVRPRFTDAVTKEREYGKVTRLRDGLGEPVKIEIPLPDFERMRIRLLFQTDGLGDKIEIGETYLLSDPQDEGALIHILDRTANTVSLEVGPLPDSRILTYLDADYAGWKATVNGAPTPILRADDAFKAVVLPAGTSRVEFRFRPWRAYAGIGVTCFTVLTGLLAMALLSRSLRRGATPPVVPVSDMDSPIQPGKPAQA